MAAKEPKKRSGRKFNVSIAVVAGMVPGANYAYTGFKNDGFNGATRNLAMAYTGYDPVGNKFNLGYMKNGTLPALLGAAVHKLANMSGVNRAIRSAGIPFISI